MFSLQNTQNFFFCFFCQPLSSFSFRFLTTFGISDRCLLLRAADPNRHVLGPVALPRAPSLLLRLGGGPLQTGTDLLRLDLDLRTLLTLGGLPAVGAKPADHH